MPQRTTALTLTVIALAQVAAADKDAGYTSQVKPLLASKCYPCHSALRQEAGLRLETRDLMIQGGDSGPVIVPGDPQNSPILQRITAVPEERMPPAGEGLPLTDEEVEVIASWLQAGAPAPREMPPAAPHQHWAFQPIQRPATPASDASEHPIDAYLNSKLKTRRLKPQPPQSRPLLIRRIYLDLIGLPPTIKQQQDERPFESIISELLSSPHYGERWGRHWMDVWRYSDWYGLGSQLRYSQKHMWRWRDWIIGSLNNDKGYDQMIQEMLAGDELDPLNPDAIAGTGFLARNYYLFNRTTWLDSTIEHTSKAFFGLTINCAKCHDHKYDPISQLDYYRLRAIFEPHQIRLDPVPGQADPDKDGLPRAFDDHPDAVTWLHKRGNPADPAPRTTITPGVPTLFSSFQPTIEKINLPLAAYAPVVRSYVRDHLIHEAERRADKARQELSSARKRLSQLQEPPASSAPGLQGDLLVADSFDTARQQQWQVTGDWTYSNGTLIRNTSTRDPETVRLKQRLPRDFEVTCHYTTTGGGVYRSVTFRFDESSDQSFCNFVYTSAHAPDPKVQVAWTRDGRQTYPQQGRSPQPIEIGQPTELRFAVRDRLINVWLNGRFVLASEYPERRPDGTFSIAGFDATVAFDDIEIRTLPANVQLVPEGTSLPTDVNTATQQVVLAEAELAAAQAHAEAVRATIAADLAKLTSADPDMQKLSAVRAARAQAIRMKADANVELLKAAGDPQKKKKALSTLKAAEEKLADSGNATYESIRVSRKALESPAHKESDYPPVYSPVSSGRRLALARWATSKQNPLTARVAVNHVWMRHFGTPLVAPVDDFGLRTAKPVHADILDFLASELMEHNWSLKHLHRLILTSAAWQRQSSTLNAAPQNLTADPDNRFYWRMNARRMDAQTIRDSILALGGTLDRKIGGPSVAVNRTSQRRSVYFLHSRDQRDRFLSMFDDADILQCYRRSESVVPQQSLALLNSKLSLVQAEKIAAELIKTSESNKPEVFAARAISAILGRPATAEESAACVRYLRAIRDVPENDAEVSADATDLRAYSRLVLSLLNHNDFITIR